MGCAAPPASPIPTIMPFPGIVPTATPWPSLRKATVTIGQAAFLVEVAATPQQLANGLSRRASLPAGTGMLFPFDRADYYAFWMKDMLMPLDLVWIDADCRVEGIAGNVPPPAPGTRDEALQMHRPRQPVRYVLEINAGEAQTRGVRVGSMAAFSGDALRDAGCWQAG